MSHTAGSITHSRFVKVPKSSDSLGVKAKTGLPQLTKQGVYILVPVSKLKLQ